MFQEQSVFMFVHEIMSRKVIKVGSDSPINYAVELMLGSSKDEVIILKDINSSLYEANVEGIITKSDIANLKRDKIDFTQPIGKFVNKKRTVFKISESETARAARDMMMDKGIGRLLVVERNTIIGIVTARDLLSTFYLKIEEIELQLRTILESLQEAVCVINTKGIVTFWNKRSEKLYGVSESAIVGKPIKNFFPNALLLKALEEKRAYENLKHKPNKDSSVVISAIPLIYEGRLIGAVSTDRDVNEITKLSMDLEREKSKVEFLQDQMQTISNDKYSFGSIIGKSKAIENAIILAKQVAKSNASVLITGESGTGKEVFARAIHQVSGRKGSFVPINCSAIPYNLLESELFGYVEGAFTGALKKGKPGKFELANGGTLFLDEIGDMPLEMQAKLLRVLQDSIITRIGSEKSISVDVRILAATNKDLQLLMSEEKFREDLYYRLNVVSILLPPLRERKIDIPDLVKDFCAEFSDKNGVKNTQIDSEVMKYLTDYGWKGNIRELRNTVERLVILSPDGKISKDKLPEDILNYTAVNEKMDDDSFDSFDLEQIVYNLEKKTIKKAMEVSGGNKAKAADLLKIKRTTLYYKLNHYEIE